MVLLTVFALTAFSQNRQASGSALFAGFPSTIDCKEFQLNKAFKAAKGEIVSLSLAGNLNLSGIVITKLAKYHNLHTMIIRLTAFSNALFSLSMQTDQKGAQVYTGRILNPLYADGLALQRSKEGNYQFIKTDTDKIIVNCNQ